MPDDQLQSRKRHRGVRGIESKVPIRDRSVLSLIYTPGVAEPCLAIRKDPVNSFEYTCRGNTIAVVTDGSKVLSLGNRGPHAALPIMEGNAVLFKTFAGVDAFPICLDTQDTDEIVRTVSLLAPTFGAICLEDIAAPRCFTVEERLERATDIPDGEAAGRSEEHTSELQSQSKLVCRLLLEKKNTRNQDDARANSVSPRTCPSSSIQMTRHPICEPRQSATSVLCAVS